MSGGTEFKNEFSWSNHRSRVFQECKRKYFLNYYDFWGGWSHDSSEETREIYILKKLTNRYMWVGSLVHDAIAEVLKSVRVGRYPSRSSVKEEFVKCMRTGYADSQRGRYRVDPKNVTGLVEHEYDEEVPDSEWKEMRDLGYACIDAFYESDILGQIRQDPPARWLAIEGDVSEKGTFADHFMIGDLKVWLILDFAFQDSDGTVHIIDWKTGKSSSDPLQLHVYGYYAWKVWDISPEQLELRFVNLAREDEYRESFSQEKLENVEQEILDDVMEMKDFLEDPEANQARKEDFPMIDETRICKRCRFRKICYDLDEVDWG